LLTLTAAVPVAAQSDQKITICQATGSPSNPWVFTTIDARDLPEHLARGDFRANSIAACSAARAPGAATPAAVAATPVTAVAATAPPPATPMATRTPVQQQGVAGGVPLPDVPVSQLVGAATTTPAPSPRTTAPAESRTPVPASTTAQQTVNVAGAQATPASEVSALPRSGGEPDRTALVLGLLGLIGAGLGLRRLGRAGLGRGRRDAPPG
jgi:hypothetical protein